MTTLICVDARPSRGRPTGLRFLRRYELVCAEAAPTRCTYCGAACAKVNVAVGGFWCARRFAKAPPAAVAVARSLTRRYRCMETTPG